MSAEENLQRMKTLDDAWNAQNWEVFRKRHSAETKVYWPGQPDPTQGRDAHHRESELRVSMADRYRCCPCTSARRRNERSCVKCSLSILMSTKSREVDQLGAAHRLIPARAETMGRTLECGRCTRGSQVSRLSDRPRAALLQTRASATTS